VEQTLFMGIVESARRDLHYAHEQGLLHRDLKPSNILIDSADQPRITDFGLAKRLDVDSQLTVTGEVLGSPGYLSPEQAGDHGEETVQSDVYALGAVLYHLLTGRPPFQGLTVEEVVHQVVNDVPIWPRVLNPQVPRDLETICLKCLRKDLEARYLSAGALADDLRRYQAGEAIEARPLTWPERAWYGDLRKEVALAFGSLLVASGVLYVLGACWDCIYPPPGTLARVGQELTVLYHAEVASQLLFGVSILVKALWGVVLLTAGALCRKHALERTRYCCPGCGSTHYPDDLDRQLPQSRQIARYLPRLLTFNWSPYLCQRCGSIFYSIRFGPRMAITCVALLLLAVWIRSWLVFRHLLALSA
jgi:hypothetical protein